MSIQSRSANVSYFIASAIPLVATLTGCGTAGPVPGESTSESAQALTTDGGPTTVVISGTVTDPIDGPQAGITITLSGSAQKTIITDFSGSFKFTVPSGGSYTVQASSTDSGSAMFFQPPFHSCFTVTPSVVNLNDLTTNTNLQFAGSGTNFFTNCSPAAAGGAASGSLTISGTVTSGGQPVSGVHVLLNGSTQGFRTTDETGAYSFSVNPGSYSVNPSGTCGSYNNPTVVNLNNLKANGVASFKGTSCPPAPLLLCPALDGDVGLSEPASCNTTSTGNCAGDRIGTWAGQIGLDFLAIEVQNDCRFGQIQVPPLQTLLQNGVGVLEQLDSVPFFALQVMGCALPEALTGPLNDDILEFPDLLMNGFTFTTADVSALEDDFVLAVNQGLTDLGGTALTSAQLTAIRAQLDAAAKIVPGVVQSSKLSYSTCK